MLICGGSLRLSCFGASRDQYSERDSLLCLALSDAFMTIPDVIGLGSGQTNSASNVLGGEAGKRSDDGLRSVSLPRVKCIVVIENLR